MSLRSDLWFVTSLIGSTIRQILGESFRTLADYLLRGEPETEPKPISVQVQTPLTPVQSSVPYRTRSSKAHTRLEVTSKDLPPEVPNEPEKPVKVRDRSVYKPKDHNGYKIAAIGVLQTLLSNDASLSRMSAPALHKIHPNSTDSTIRIACKTMVKDGILATEYSDDVRSDVYWVLNREAAQNHLAELEVVAPQLPISDEP
jgi:hypothetical protein